MNRFLTSHQADFVFVNKRECPSAIIQNLTSKTFLHRPHTYTHTHTMTPITTTQFSLSFHIVIVQYYCFLPVYCVRFYLFSVSRFRSILHLKNAMFSFRCKKNEIYLSICCFCLIKIKGRSNSIFGAVRVLVCCRWTGTEERTKRTQSVWTTKAKHSDDAADTIASGRWISFDRIDQRSIQFVFIQKNLKRK